jgi:hypothetical protein
MVVADADHGVAPEVLCSGSHIELPLDPTGGTYEVFRGSVLIVGDPPEVHSRLSRPHRYGYSAVIGEVSRSITVSGEFSDDAFANAILRHDLVAGTAQAREFGRDATVGRPSSPRPPRTQAKTTATSWRLCTTPTLALRTW